MISTATSAAEFRISENWIDFRQFERAQLSAFCHELHHGVRFAVSQPPSRWSSDSRRHRWIHRINVEAHVEGFGAGAGDCDGVLGDGVDPSSVDVLHREYRDSELFQHSSFAFIDAPHADQCGMRRIEPRFLRTKAADLDELFGPPSQHHRQRHPVDITGGRGFRGVCVTVSIEPKKPIFLPSPR